MTLVEKQTALDEEKWLKSESLGRDVCGEFEYCKFCDKGMEFPCANAHNLYEADLNEKAKKEKASVSKSTVKSATKTASKTATKTCAKKTTTKKATK